MCQTYAFSKAFNGLCIAWRCQLAYDKPENCLEGVAQIVLTASHKDPSASVCLAQELRQRACSSAGVCTAGEG